MSNKRIYFSSPSSENDLIGEELSSSIKDIFSSQVLILGAIDQEGKVVLLHPSQKTEDGLPIA